MGEINKLTFKTVEEFLTKKFGSAVSNVSELSSGMFSKAYSYELNGDEFVLRLNGDIKDFKKDIYAYKNFGDKLPISEILEYEKFDEEFYFAIMHKHQGVTHNKLNRNEVKIALPEIINTLETIRSIDVSKKMLEAYLNPNFEAASRKKEFVDKSVEWIAKHFIKKIISGGQAGVDRAALDVAIKLNIAHGGWCPHGRRAEDGVISSRYLLEETPTAEYSERTKWNVRDSDGVLIIVRGQPVGGTLLTVKEARKLKKPCLIFDLAKKQSFDTIVTWIKKNNIQVLDVAGPRASQAKNIYSDAYDVITELLGHFAKEDVGRQNVICK